MRATFYASDNLKQIIGSRPSLNKIEEAILLTGKRKKHSEEMV